ncbi:hypothetical protein BC832DRAFT_355365 [Gaertneriomyces semiglobifer]|nr:hypothetical protein BC832DRAFT_355365 [Gaertneriomyces semiglobifer]
MLAYDDCRLDSPYKCPPPPLSTVQGAFGMCPKARHFSMASIGGRLSAHQQKNRIYLVNVSKPGVSSRTLGFWNWLLVLGKLLGCTLHCRISVVRSNPRT